MEQWPSPLDWLAPLTLGLALGYLIVLWSCRGAWSGYAHRPLTYRDGWIAACGTPVRLGPRGPICEHQIQA